MTFDEIVSEVCDRLNLTSDEAVERVGKEVNRRYRRVTSSIGMISTRRIHVSVDCVGDTADQTVEGIEKIISVSVSSEDPYRVLSEVTYEEMVAIIPDTQRATCYAIKRHFSGEVDIRLNFEAPTPDGTLTLDVEGYELASDLSDDIEPAFPESFHELLVMGAMADEYRKMEKPALSRDCEMDYERLISDLRLFLAKSSYLDLVQGQLDNRTLRPFNRRFVV